MSTPPRRSAVRIDGGTGIGMTGIVPMRLRPCLIAFVLAVGSHGIVVPARAQAPDAGTPNREMLRKDWHRCLRQSFSGQPARLRRESAERAALAACKPQEDAYVAAELAAQFEAEDAARRTDRGLVARARAALASVTAYVFEPAAAWLGGVAGR